MTQSPLYAPDQYPVSKRQVLRRPRPNRQSPQPLSWLLSGIALAALALVPQEQLSRWLAPLAAPHIEQQSVQAWPLSQRSSANTCQTVLNAEQRLSRDQLAQFVSLAKGTPQDTVHNAIAPPHCMLSKANNPKQQEAYPLAFDPDTWFVVNYDQGSYADYGFVFKEKE